MNHYNWRLTLFVVLEFAVLTLRGLKNREKRGKNALLSLFKLVLGLNYGFWYSRMNIFQEIREHCLRNTRISFFHPL